MVILVPYRQGESAESYGDYYAAQAGGAIPAYAGRTMMGKGLGNIFGGLLRAATPMLKKIGSTVGKRALKTGLAVANNVLGETDVKTSVKKGFKRGGGELLNDLVSAMSSTPPPPKRAKKKTRKPKSPRRLGKPLVI